jgi:hypothetical protein
MPPYGTSGGKSNGKVDPPPISAALLEYLERTFPDRLGDENESVRSLRFRSGIAHVVRHLRAVHERQNRNVLTPESMK